jgi:hypothetical protein
MMRKSKIRLSRKFWMGDSVLNGPNNGRAQPKHARDRTMTLKNVFGEVGEDVLIEGRAPTRPLSSQS